ncbi:GPW/gp25 family protein [Ralstonia pseudosolanacearum]|uniref:GpW/gp25 family protein n=1 Tax=Ralstonia phage RSA1 TaxID=2993856 RepID=A4PE42_9CAUD|nr:GPW/gp25 family protein [Ralstonia pseudosolanacearum]YP_001165269.1 baseplate wedge subunit [Ralstonia phage RSA1]BAF52397.1 gpW/gp25 family protein [Ralstonia phage RSA1]BCL90694.1 baseplate assembly protein [Ralstonia solanacearum]BCN03258.1 baseplate assembly protein [Ralstonia solanacearum]
MTGMNNATGRALADQPHVVQSVRDILSTPIGSRVMRRDYGSQVPDLIDQPLNPATRLRTMSAAVSALVRWEPRIRIASVRFWIDADGKPVIDIEADRVDGPRREAAGTLSVPLRS